MIVLAPHGVRTMVMGFVVVSSSWVFVWFYFVHRYSGYQLVSFLKDTAPFVLSALGVMVLTHFVTAGISNLWLSLISRIVIAATLYYVVMRLADAKILNECTEFIKQKMTKSSR